jgi:phage anti-repressor protein
MQHKEKEQMQYPVLSPAGQTVDSPSLAGQEERRMSETTVDLPSLAGQEEEQAAVSPFDSLTQYKEDGEPYVCARKLHRELKSRRHFSDWVLNRLETYGFVEGKGYYTILSNRSDGLPGKPRKDYHLTITTAKEFAMVENNEEGRAARRHFIIVEEKRKKKKAYGNLALENKIKELQKVNELQDEIVKWARFFREQVEATTRQDGGEKLKVDPKQHAGPQNPSNAATGEDPMSMRETAKRLNIGFISLFSALRTLGVFDANNVPREEYQNCGYFKVVEKPYKTRKGETHISRTTRVYSAGVDFIRRLLKKAN